jgi:phosphate transport system substrate-binding protein
MAGTINLRRLGVWIVSGVVVAASALAMAWMWRSGGVDLTPGDAPMRQTEECGAVIAGSTAMTVRLAPTAVAAFLHSSGYEIDSAAAPPTEGVQIVGLRGTYRCTVTIHTNNSTQGFRDLASGEALIALSQRPITQRDIEMLRAANAGDFVEQRGRAEHVVGFDAYAMVVADSNPVRSVNLDQARDMALGGIGNWRQLGGADAPIRLYAVVDGVMPEDYPNDIIQASNPVWQEARERGEVLATETEAAEALARDPSGLGFMSGAFVGGSTGVRALALSTGGPPQEATAENIRAEIYPLARRLFVYVRPSDMESNAFVQRFVAFIKSPEAFDLIDETGFVALRPESRLARNAANLSGCRFGTPEYSALMTVTQGATRLPEALRFNGMELDASAEAYVASHAGEFRERLRAGDAIVLIGHADVSGANTANRALALRRAVAVRTAFERMGVFGISAESAGEVCALGDNDTEDGRALNRRVEIWVRPRETR